MSTRAAALLLVASLCACGGKPPVKEITETRVIDAASKHAETPPGLPAAPGALPPGHPSLDAPPFTWETPPGWEPQTGSAMRVANFRLAANPDVECYLTVLQGAAGGTEANINRWRGQMGQEAFKPEDIAALPRIEALGKQGAMVETVGSFTGMNGDAKSGYALLGMIVELPERSVFVKMTGPEAAVKAEKDHFLVFCRSLKAATS